MQVSRSVWQLHVPDVLDANAKLQQHRQRTERTLRQRYFNQF
jgi:hypothetical protein